MSQVFLFAVMATTLVSPATTAPFTTEHLPQRLPQLLLRLATADQQSLPQSHKGFAPQSYLCEARLPPSQQNYSPSPSPSNSHVGHSHLQSQPQPQTQAQMQQMAQMTQMQSQPFPRQGKGPRGWEPERSYQNYHLQDFSALMSDHVLLTQSSLLTHPKLPEFGWTPPKIEEQGTPRGKEEPLQGKSDRRRNRPVSGIGGLLHSLVAWIGEGPLSACQGPDSGSLANSELDFGMNGSQSAPSLNDERPHTFASAPPQHKEVASWGVRSVPATEPGQGGGVASSVAAARVHDHSVVALSSEETHAALRDARLAIVSLKGTKCSSPNQDRAVAVTFSSGKLLGVYDGHGQEGHIAAELCCEGLPRMLLRALSQAGGLDMSPTQCQQATGRSFTAMHCDFEDMPSASEAGRGCGLPSGLPSVDARVCGTTGTVVIFQGSQMLVSHVGDSTAVLGTRRGGCWRSSKITRDHKPDLPAERPRIESCGSQVHLQEAW